MHKHELGLPKTKPGKEPENYGRILDPRCTSHGAGFVTATYLGFTWGTDRDQLLNLPGAEKQSTVVKFTHVDSVSRPGCRQARQDMTAGRLGDSDGPTAISCRPAGDVRIRQPDRPASEGRTTGLC